MSKIVAILSHVPAPKAHTSQETVHRYDHTRGTTRPSPSLTHPTRSYRTRATWPVPARSCQPSQVHLASHARRPGQPSLPNRPAVPPPPCQPSLQTRPAVPPDPAHHASQPGPPSQPTRPAEPTSLDKVSASTAMPSTRPASYLSASCSSTPV